LQPSLRSIAKISTKAKTRKSHPASELKSQQETAPNTIHNAIARLPKISKDLEYSFGSVLIGFNSFSPNPKVQMTFNARVIYVSLFTVLITLNK
jgi:hypothetical protein